MYNKKILEFYQKIKNDKAFKENLLRAKNEFKNISNLEEKLSKIITDLIIPAAKKKGYNFTEKELLEHEKKATSDSFSQLNTDELSLVSGGIGKLAALSLTLLIGASSIATSANAYNPSPKVNDIPPHSSPKKSNTAGFFNSKKLKTSSLSFATNLSHANYMPIGGRYDSGYLEFIFNPKFTGNVVIQPNDIANFFLDNGISFNLSSNVDIKICSNANINLGEHLGNTVISMDMDRNVKSVSLKSDLDPNIIMTLTSKDFETWLLSSQSPEIHLTYQDLEDFIRGWNYSIIRSIEVEDGHKLTFCERLQTLGWKATNNPNLYRDWMGRWTHKETFPNLSTKPETYNSSNASSYETDSSKQTTGFYEIIPSVSNSHVGETSPMQPQIFGNFVGLQNIGNSCFLNSLFQQFYNIHNFKTFILNNTFNTETQPTALGLQTLFKGMQQAVENGPSSMNNLNKLSRTAINIMNSSSAGPIFNGKQEDAHEAFIKILDRCASESEELKSLIEKEFNIKGKSVISYKGQTLHTDSVSDRGIILPINKNLKDQRITDMLANYFSPEDITYRVENHPEMVTAQKKLTVTRLPNTLQIEIGRFGYASDFSGKVTSTKLNDRIEFSEFFPIDNDNIYMLTGIIIHSGSISGGHYYSYVKEDGSDKWYKLNDSEVSPAGTFGDIKEECVGDGTSKKSAYVLFYKRLFAS